MMSPCKIGLSNQCRIQQFFLGASFSTSIARRKTIVQPGSLGRCCRPFPVGSRGKTLEVFGYFAFRIAQNIALLALQQGTLTKTYTRNQHFWAFGGLSLGSKLVYQFQNNSALVLIAGFRAGLNLGYLENPALKPRKPSLVGSLIFSYLGLNWVSWVLKNYELGYLFFKKLWIGFSWFSWVLKNYELGLARLAGFWNIISWV